jgi:hypothetical protein
MGRGILGYGAAAHNPVQISRAGDLALSRDARASWGKTSL